MPTTDYLSALHQRLRTPAGRWRVDALLALPNIEDFLDEDNPHERYTGDLVDLTDNPIKLTSDLVLYDGTQRLQDVAEHGARFLTEHSVKVSQRTAAAAEHEMWDRNWPRLTGRTKAAAIRSLMRRRNWSMGQVARSLGISQQAVSKLLATYPAAANDEALPEVRVGIDGKQYRFDGAHRGRRGEDPARRAARSIERHAAEIGPLAERLVADVADDEIEHLASLAEMVAARWHQIAARLTQRER